MNVQSLSIDVPTGICLNVCEYCVSRMHESPYENRIGAAINDIAEFSSSTIRAKEDYIKRLHFAKEQGINNLILTGRGECIQNKDFLKWFGDINKNEIGFRWIEIQTSGNLLLKNKLVEGSDNKPSYSFYENFAFLRSIGVSTISLSVADIFDSKNNCEIIHMSKSQHFELEEMCSKIKEFNFNLRVSINVSSNLNNKTTQQIFDRLNILGADQVTFRKLYISPEGNTNQDKWIIDHPIKQHFFENLQHDILKKGFFLGKLPFGALKYDVDGISIVIDDNCMNEMSETDEKRQPDVYKYIILRPNCKLYSDWSRKSSLIF